MNNTNTATVRTAWNGAIISAFLIGLAKVFGWNVELDDLAPFLPVIVAVIAVVYRASLALAEWKPVLGKILFGKTAAPVYPPPAPRDGNDVGESTLATLLMIVALVAIIIWVLSVYR